MLKVTITYHLKNNNYIILINKFGEYFGNDKSFDTNLNLILIS